VSGGAAVMPASIRPVGLLACGFLLLAGAALPAWRWSLGLRPDLQELLICAALPALGLLALGWAGPARQVMLRIVCCVFMLPLLLLMWGSSLPRAPEAAAPAARLPDERLFAGALAQQELPAAQLQGSGILLMRSAAFADGSELRLIRFEHAEAAQHYREQLAQVLRDAAPLAPRLALHGADLIELRAASPALLQARWQALDLPAPPTAPDADPAPFWPFGLAFGTAHLAFALGFLLWAGTLTTRLPPRPGRAAVTPALLGMRLRALTRSGLPLAVAHDGEGQWRVEHRGLAAGRSHVALLRLDPQRRRVQVRELLTANAAAPQDEDEASLRGSLADPAFDPARPRASHVWQRMVQTTMLEPARVAALRPGFEGDRLRLPAAASTGLDGEGMVTLLAALVTASGWRWQPVFWFSR
jgi:hypothetical protein